MRLRPFFAAVCSVYFFGMSCAVSLATEIDVTPPQVVSTSPINGMQNVNPDVTELRVTFSKQMRDGSWSWVQEDPSSFPEMTGQPRYEDGASTCVLPVRLVPGKHYVIWLNSGRFRNFMSEAGLPLPPYRWEFRTAE